MFNLIQFKMMIKKYKYVTVQHPKAATNPNKIRIFFEKIAIKTIIEYYIKVDV